jgi:hypothetical protein
MFEQGAFPKPIPENPHAVANNQVRIMDAIGKFAHWNRKKLRPPGRLEKYSKRLDPRTQLHVTGERSLRTAYPNLGRNVFIPMPDAGQDSELKIQNLFQLGWNGLNSDQICHFELTVRVGAHIRAEF